MAKVLLLNGSPHALDITKMRSVKALVFRPQRESSALRRRAAAEIGADSAGYDRNANFDVPLSCQMELLK